MASENELYISINKDSYRANKLNVLTNQADLLSTLKRLQNLKVLARRKNDLKKKIQRKLITVVNNIESIQKAVPTPKVPKVIKKREAELKKHEEYEEPVDVHEQASKRAEIEGELLTIQEKLRELNS